jgi:hypothetical protein
MKAKIKLWIWVAVLGTAFGITAASKAPIGKPMQEGPVPICRPGSYPCSLEK